MNPQKAIEENKRLTREWFRNVYAMKRERQEDRLDEITIKQRESLNRKKGR
jgi:hypothetical protein